MSFGANSQTESVKRVLEMMRATDEKTDGRDLLFLAELTKKKHSKLRRSHPKQPNVGDSFVSGPTGANSQ